MNTETIGDNLKKSLRRLSYATIGVYMALIGVGSYVMWDAHQKRNDIAEVTNSTNQVLCTFRHDLEVRATASKDFLRKHPDGIPGISAVVIQQGITNQEKTISSLASLNCPPDMLEP